MKTLSSLAQKTPAAAFYVCFLPLACAPWASTPNAGGNGFLRKLALSRCASWTNSSAGAVQTTVCPVVRLLVSPGLRALRGLKARPRSNGRHRSVAECKALIHDSRDCGGHHCVNTDACSNKTRKLCFSIPHFCRRSTLVVWCTSFHVVQIAQCSFLFSSKGPYTIGKVNNGKFIPVHTSRTAY